MYLQKVINRKNFFLNLRSVMKIAGSGSGSISQRLGSKDPDPYINVMDPQHCVNIHGFLFVTVSLRGESFTKIFKIYF
jgi:hypothetical protein